ncbi:MAG: ADP-ribosylglycohydrolase family protein [Zoogloeaceae bacterium]|jgi:ADP-ribosyl-[dinitrogen reductase] hydrolase|nr:ADP-ribosylglycohydrolase family protein [Zoogloeaceae bacterium]
MQTALPPNSETQARLREKAVGAYLGLAIGDALGATVEFMTPGEIRRDFARQGGAHRDIIGGGWLRLKAGQTTDDTSMSLALGEAILADSGRVEALSAARAFDQWMRAKPTDIGNTVRRNLIRFRTTGETEAPVSEHDAGNGAVMRFLPVALATFGQEAAMVAAAFRAQAHVTHNNPLSDAGGECLLAMLHSALSSCGRQFSFGQGDVPFPSGGERQGTGEALPSATEHCRPQDAQDWEEIVPRKILFAEARALEARYREFSWSAARRQENPSGYIAHTLIAVFQAFFGTESFEACLIDVVNRGGDADTTGAIAGALAGAWYGLEAIPPRWKNALEAKTAHRCAEQAERLLACA